jgi:hypothetical protein
VLGPPDYVGADGRTLVFEYQVVTWWELLAFPFGIIGGPHESSRYLRLGFDPDGALAAAKVYASFGSLHAAAAPGRLLHYSDYRKSRGVTRDETPLPPLGGIDGQDSIGGPP